VGIAVVIQKGLKCGEAASTLKLDAQSNNPHGHLVTSQHKSLVLKPGLSTHGLEHRMPFDCEMVLNIRHVLYLLVC
jgi:hypothetical protein